MSESISSNKLWQRLFLHEGSPVKWKSGSWKKDSKGRSVQRYYYGYVEEILGESVLVKVHSFDGFKVSKQIRLVSITGLEEWKPRDVKHKGK